MNIAKKLIITTISGLSITLASTRLSADNISTPQGQHKKVVTKSDKEMKSIIERFIRGDKTLKDKDFAAIYYGYNAPNGANLQKELITMTDRYIKNHQFDEALMCAKEAVNSLPYDLGLLNRLCDLAQHNRNSKVDLYVWQLASLFHIINYSGDGSNFEKAYKVRGLRDAYLFETLWQQTPMNDIKGKAEFNREGTKFFVLTIKNKNAEVRKNYYQVVTPSSDI